MESKELLELGFKVAGGKLKEAEELKKKLAVAYEHFRFVTPAVWERFGEELKKKTYKRVNKNNYIYDETYDRVVFIPVSEYKEIPPPECLAKMKEAIEMKCLDSFEIAKTEQVSNHYDTTPAPDPIIFGRINKCDDRFFIAQWDEDLKIEQILNETEG